MKIFRTISLLGKTKRAFETVNEILDEIEHKLQSQSNQFAKQEIEMLLSATYGLRKNALDNIENGNLDLRLKIYVKSLSSIKIRIYEAIDVTETRIMRLAGIMQIQNEVTNILEKGELFYIIEKHDDLGNRG